jgi:hypothetical protein
LTVNILSMLVRLQGTLGRTDLVNEMVLLPQAKAASHLALPDDVVNLVVGYSNSPRSQAALDITLWIAHQTRLATGKQVTVQVVYVLDDNVMNRIPVFDANVKHRGHARKVALQAEGGSSVHQTAIAEASEVQVETTPCGTVDLFEKADQILWNARCLAEEWRGSLKTHLRFGKVAKELREVVESEKASLLILGCESIDHPLVQQLDQQFPCPVLGIPSEL